MNNRQWAWCVLMTIFLSASVSLVVSLEFGINNVESIRNAGRAAMEPVGANETIPCEHEWACVSHHGFSDIDSLSCWTFKCSRCNLHYERSLDKLCEAERDLIQAWCGCRPPAKRQLPWSEPDASSIIIEPRVQPNAWWDGERVYFGLTYKF